ncbi:LysM peptidoglycan-binding domain-containing protein [Brevibacillus humidisoli]|uniref:LysM peptidoglycan-binding domain-containing protein n=1 Tax=Brevibacillus humidisoli TaxID=2895522 RepID=UPI001E4E6EFF|nr:LysM domain-containing protein [Brevibacillus humidisoli]UFJ42819.1 LysM peptidoglycan-binding domain-containing protein [Brevibacillus humidisoli]
MGPSDDRSSTREKSVQTGTDSQQLSAAGSHPTEQVENQENFPSAAANPQVEGSSVNQLPTKSTPAPNVVKHTVQKGDTLFKLSRHYYGNNQGWKRIARYNGLDPDDSLPIGKVLSIPSPTRS